MHYTKITKALDGDIRSAVECEVSFNVIWSWWDDDVTFADGFKAECRARFNEIREELAENERRMKEMKRKVMEMVRKEAKEAGRSAADVLDDLLERL